MIPIPKYQAAAARVHNQIDQLDWERRSLMTDELVELLDEVDQDDHRMALDEFVECVRNGGFIDYDGYGKYVKDGHVTNITIYPSDVKQDNIHRDFDSIVWYNR